MPTNIMAPVEVEADRRRNFTEVDDLRLIAIMEHHPRPLRRREWCSIAAELTHFSASQCRERWHNYLKPPWNRSRFEAGEIKDIAKEAIGKLGHWTEIAESLKGDKRRSPAMLKSLVTNLFARLRKIGIRLRYRDEVDLVPSDVWTTRTRREALAGLLKEFDDARVEYKANKGLERSNDQ